jgi:hypothetical protein
MLSYQEVDIERYMTPILDDFFHIAVQDQPEIKHQMRGAHPR